MENDYCTIYSPIIWEGDKEYKATPIPVTDQVLRENEKFKRICGKPKVGLRMDGHLGLRLTSNIQ